VLLLAAGAAMLCLLPLLLEYLGSGWKPASRASPNGTTRLAAGRVGGSREIRDETLAASAWLLVPLPVVVWHYGPGQKWLARDQAHSLIRRGWEAESERDWAKAENYFREASGLVGNTDRRVKAQLDLALVRARLPAGRGVDAIDGIDRLLADPGFPTVPTDLQREVRELAGRIHYHAAWVMRLEGAQRDLWMEEAELAGRISGCD